MRRGLMSRPFKRGDKVRTPNRPSAKWRSVVRIYKRRDGAVMVVFRTDREYRALGLPPKSRIALSVIEAIGFAVKRKGGDDGEAG